MELVELSKLKSEDKVKVIIGQYGNSNPVYTIMTKAQLLELAAARLWGLPHFVFKA